MSRNILAASTVIALVVAAFPALAEKRQLGPHEHGHGTLNIAIEGNKTAIELDAPGADIAGFEHVATTPEDKAQAAKAEADLKEALKLFVLPSAAACKLVKADIEVEAEHEHHEQKEDHDHEDKKDHDGHESKEAHEAKEAHEDHNHANEVRHSEYNATYELECANAK